MKRYRAFAVAMAVALSIDVIVAVNLPGSAWAAGGPSVPLPGTNSVSVTQESMGSRGQDDTSRAALKGNQDTAPAGKSGSGAPTATSLSPSATWDVSAHTGSFSWSYPMRVPSVPGGLMPSVGLSYSSSAVDGLTSASNTQASWVGDGWAMWPGFIERSYGSCSDDLPGDPKTNPVDLCWRTDNATMSLGGSGSRLIRNADGVWRPEQDDGSRVERFADGLGVANGDDNGEYWRITTVDGMQYFFGSRPESQSTWTVPVFGDDAGEPCHNGAYDASSCVQGYRWNLDKVVDRHGNMVVHQYQAETNFYGRNKSKSGAKYTRDGWLERIDYGLKEGQAGPASARVRFDTTDRCVPGSECTFSKPNNLPDVPLNHKCDGGTCPEKWAPTFWTTKRLSKVTTEVRSGDGYAGVDTWDLRHEFPAPGDGEKAGLWLASVKHSGLAGTTAITLPEVTFEGVRMANRVSGVGDPYAALYRFRMNAIVSESGGVTSIKYKDPECVVGWPTPADAHTNTLRCFPAWWAASGSPERTDYFHKYVVESVTVFDRPGTTVGDVTSYEYLGGAAWRFDKSELTKEDKKTWNDFRGFANVKVKKGTGHDGPVQVVEHKFYRGMHGDKLAPTGGTRSATIVDSEGASRGDEDWLSGRTRESITYDGTKVVSKTITEPSWKGPTAVRGPYKAYKVFTGATDTYISLEAGGRRVTRSETTYNDDGLPVTVNDLADTGTPADDRCTTTTYARNSAKWMLSLPSRVQTVAVNCATPTKFPEHALTDVRTSYDGQAHGAEPTFGNGTRLEQLENHPSTGPEYTTTVTTKYDGYGRAVEVADTFGNVSKTAYKPDTGIPTETVATNAVGHTATSTLDIRTGQAVKVVDANGNITETTYDALGRITETWLGNRWRSEFAEGNAQFSYLISRDQPSVVTTKSINAAGKYNVANTIYDGLLRVRQVQAPAPGGGRMLTDTRYDSAGRVYKSTQPYFNNAPVDTKWWSATDAEVPAMTLIQFDGAGRPVKQTFKGVARQWETTTRYGGDRVYVNPPQGATPTTTITDARGQTVELRQHKSDTEFDTTRYEYSTAGALHKMTDPAGNVWTYSHDLRGRKIREEDPDRGTTTTTYDRAGRIATTTDARNTTLAYAYDTLGRKTATHQGSLTGPKIASWTYDTADWGLGKPATATRWIDGNAYIQKVAGYDGLYNPLRTVTSIPAAETGFGGDYVSDMIYAPDGSLRAYTLPKIGGLANEQVTHIPDDELGLPSTTYGGLSGVGTTEYAMETLYTKYAEPQRIQLGEDPKRVWLSFYYEDDTRRVKRTIVDAQIPKPMVADVHYTRDLAGRITSIADTTLDTVPDRQCFAYDHLQRLTEAWTPKGTCSDARSTSALGGPAPYWQSFTYDKIGNRLTETQHAAAGDTLRTYTYPPAGHRLQSVSTKTPIDTKLDEFGYDNLGNTTRRKLATGGEQSLDWDAQGQLAKVTEAGKVTEFVYDANGSRLVRRDPTSVTLYLSGQELRIDKNTKAKQATRYYSHAGGVVAMRTEAGVTWLAGDHQGTAQISLNSQTLEVTRRRQTPFGGARGQSVAFPGEKGFVGGTVDAAIGLTSIGARQYDTAIGRFVSVDPVISPQDPQQWHGYAYANNNPITFSDPTGELYCDGCDYSDWKDDSYGSDWNEPDGSPRAPTDHREETRRHNVRNGLNKDRSKQPVIRGITVPIFDDLKARPGGHGYADGEYGEAVSDWAKKLCSGSGINSGFCSKARDIGLLAPKNPGLNDFLFALTPMSDMVDCISGNGCLWLAANLIPGAKLAKGLETAVSGARALGSSTSHAFNSFIDSGKAFCSFVPGTLVLMADGTYKPIEQLQIGDLVLATDPETGETGPRAVLAPLTSEGIKNLVQLTIDTDGPAGNQTGTLIATDNHPFWSPDLRTWLTADELRVGSLLSTSAGGSVQVEAIRTWTAHQRVHNLTVDDIHTYYVVAGAIAVLVHNQNGLCGVGDFRGGDMFYHALETDKGRVEMMAGVHIDGDNLHLSDVAVYGTGGMARGSLGQADILRELRSVIAPAAAEQGFTTLRITAVRASGNPGHQVDLTLDLTKYRR